MSNHDEISVEIEQLAFERAKLSPETWALLVPYASDPSDSEGPTCHLNGKATIGYWPDEDPAGWWLVSFNVEICNDGKSHFVVIKKGHALFDTIDHALDDQSHDWIVRCIEDQAGPYDDGDDAGYFDYRAAIGAVRTI